MITQNILMEMISGKSSANNAVKRTRNTTDKYSSDFSDVFKETLNKNESNKSVKQGNDKPVNTYKQVSSNKAIGNKSQDKNLNKAQQDINGFDTDDREKVKEKSVLNGIAELLGLSLEELVSAMSTIGIKPDELCSEETVNDAVSKLSEVLNLTEGQNGELKSIIGKINTIVDSTIEQAESNSLATGKEGWVKVEGVNIEVENNKKANLKELAALLDSKIHELVKSVKNDNNFSFNEITQKLRQITQDISLQSIIGDVDENRDKTDYDTSDDSKSDLSDSDKDTGNMAKAMAEQPALSGINSQDTVKANNQDTVIPGNINISGASNTVELKRADRTINDIKTVRNEIMSQVVEKAKVMLDDNKSEMIMELKPESLGKLSLKVVTESGIVVAKFIAENQQVKEIIESNMQLLKDSLEKQGLAVQGFSVSVGQDSGRGFNNPQNMNRGNHSGISRGDAIDGILNVPISDGLNTVTNPYESNGSSVDFRA